MRLNPFRRKKKTTTISATAPSGEWSCPTNNWWERLDMHNEQDRELVNQLWAVLEGFEYGRRKGWLAYGVGRAGWLSIRIPAKTLHVKALVSTLEYALAAQQKDKLQETIEELVHSVGNVPGKPVITCLEDEFKLVYDYTASKYVNLCEMMKP